MGERLQINFQRLKHNLEELSRIGRAEDHGIHRMAFTEADMRARHWLSEQIEAANLTLYQDGAANLSGRLNWQEE